MLSLLKKLLSSFWGGVWGAQKPPENLKIGILGGFGGPRKYPKIKKYIFFQKFIIFYGLLASQKYSYILF